MQRAEVSRPVRVLVVEDQPAVRDAIASEFERDPDFELVGPAASVSEAREMLQGVELAVLDLGLPDGFGADLIPELRAVNPTVQAVVLSSNHDPAEAARAIECGAAVVLDKMMHLGQVADCARRVLAGKSLPSEDDHV